MVPHLFYELGPTASFERNGNAKHLAGRGAGVHDVRGGDFSERS